MRLPLVALVIGLAGALVPAASSATPADQPVFAVKPVTYDPKVPVTKSYFVLDARPGTVIHDRVEIVNKGDVAGRAFLYTVDATTGETTGAVYLSRRDPRRDVGSWLTLDADSVVLGPGERRDVSFTVRVPRALRPGDHLGGIVAENAALTKPKGKGPLQIKIRHLTIVAVQAQVPGPRIRRIDVAGVRAGGEHGYQFLYLSMRSRSTIMVKPRLTVSVADEQGRAVARRSLRLDTFLPQTQIDYPLLLPGRALSPGRYVATIDVSDGSGTQTFPFSVSQDQTTKVYSGAPALKPARAGGSGGHHFPIDYLPWIVAALATLGAAAAITSRRWASR